MAMLTALQYVFSRGHTCSNWRMAKFKVVSEWRFFLMTFVHDMFESCRGESVCDAADC